MLESDFPLAKFDAAISSAKTANACWAALWVLATEIAGCKLFTVTTVDMAAGLARRAFSSNPDAYPVSGTKPIERNSWFAIVHDRREVFVANTLADIAAVFPDHKLIESLGCGSVVNLPVVLAGELAATVNLLDAGGHYLPARVAAISTRLPMPAKLALLAARQFNAAGAG